jgi:hypothetical protein
MPVIPHPIRTFALPAAGASVNSASIDLDAIGVSRLQIPLQVRVPKTPSLPAGESIVVKFQDSADNASFADVSLAMANQKPATLTIQGSSKGGVADELNVSHALQARRYVRAVATASASAGDNTAVIATLEIPNLVNA